MLMLLVFIAIVAVVYFMYQPKSKSASPTTASAEYVVFGQGEYEEIGGDISEYDNRE